jgi:hypothetical protein
MTVVDEREKPCGLDAQAELREIKLVSDGGLPAIASAFACETSAIVGLFPFMVDGEFTTVLAAACRPPRNAELVSGLGASSVRHIGASELLLGVQLARFSPPALIDGRLLVHDEVVACLHPPHGYALVRLEDLQAELDATVVALR